MPIISGIPIVNLAGTADPQEGLAVLAPKVNHTAGSICAAILRTRTEPQILVVDSGQRKIWGTGDADTRNAFLACLASPDSWLTVQPWTLGLITLWNVTSNNGFGDVSPYINAYNKRSLEQIINHFCRDDNLAFAFADQNTWAVKLMQFADPQAVSDALNLLTVSDFTACFQLREKQKTNNIFE